MVAAASITKIRFFDISIGDSLMWFLRQVFRSSSSFCNSEFHWNLTFALHRCIMPGYWSCIPGQNLFNCAAQPAIIWHSFLEEGVSISRKSLIFLSSGEMRTVFSTSSPTGPAASTIMPPHLTLRPHWSFRGLSLIRLCLQTAKTALILSSSSLVSCHPRGRHQCS